MSDNFAYESLKSVVREYLREFDTPAPDLKYRSFLRDKLKKMVAVSSPRKEKPE